MAGLNTLHQKFVRGEAKLHLNSPSGNYPLYTITDKDGNIETVAGTWEPITDSLGNDREITVEEAVTIAVPIPPEAPKGFTILPVELLIRNIKSPDAEKFRKDRDLDLKARQRNAKNPKTNKAQMSDEKVQLISTASCVAGFVNVPMDSEDGVTKMMEYSEEAVMLFLKEDFPLAQELITMFVIDQKKFDSLS